MKYERLTERDERGFPCIKGVSPENLYKGIDDMNEAVSVTWAVKRLAELEDKIEAGTFVEVPKGAVVLTPEERAEEMRLCNEERKQAVEEFADEFKRRYFFMMTTYMKDPIYQCTGDELDRLVKEVCKE